MTEREQIEELHRKYLSLRDNTPMMHRDGEECKAYHMWYDSAYVYFKSFASLKNDPDFQIFVSAKKEGNCFVLADIYDSISPSYKVLMQNISTIQNTDTNVKPETKTPMVFISHSSKDMAFVEALVTLLESIGFDNKTLFCSSIPDYWIGLSKDIFASLKHLFINHELFVIFVQSPRYYESAVSLNEMGAAWVLQTDYCSILTKDMKKEQMLGVFDDHTIFLKVDDPQVEARMNELKNTLENIFSLPTMSETTWERKRNIFLKAVNAIEYKESFPQKGTLSDEYMMLQIRKMKQEEEDRKKANIHAYIISGNKGSRTLYIENQGQSKASNIRISMPEPDQVTAIHPTIPCTIDKLHPGDHRNFRLLLCEGDEELTLTFEWEDEFSKENKESQTIDL